MCVYNYIKGRQIINNNRNIAAKVILWSTVLQQPCD